MTGTRALLWVLGAVFAFALVLCGLAVRELADGSRCSTGEFDTVQVERLDRQWVPPGVRCRVTLRDGSTHEADVDYWPAFALALASGTALAAAVIRARRRPPDPDAPAGAATASGDGHST